MQPGSGIVLITGSSGLIGSAVTKRLAGEYARIIGLDLKEPKMAPPENFTYLNFDITSDDNVRQALETAAGFGPRVASVIHLAAFYDFSGAPNPCTRVSAVITSPPSPAMVSQKRPPPTRTRSSASIPSAVPARSRKGMAPPQSSAGALAFTAPPGRPSV